MMIKANKLDWPEEMLRMSGGELSPVTENEYQLVKKINESLGLDDRVFCELYEVYLQVASWINSTIDLKSSTKIIGINGAQGTGKSTAASIICSILEVCFNVRTCILSIDDIYHTRSERIRLAKDVHSLLLTRGVPGTHDIALGERILRELKSAGSDNITKIPRFNKAADDRESEDKWVSYKGRPNVIIFEGWCVGAIPQDNGLLLQPQNELERLSDNDCLWRNYVNKKLFEYQKIFQKIDLLIMLKAPGFERIHQWRLLQEQKLKQKTDGDKKQAKGLMDEAQIKHFIGHFERLTRWMLSEMPRRADIVLALDDAHQINKITTNHG